MCYSPGAPGHHSSAELGCGDPFTQVEGQARPRAGSTTEDPAREHPLFSALASVPDRKQAASVCWGWMTPPGCSPSSLPGTLGLFFQVLDRRLYFVCGLSFPCLRHGPKESSPTHHSGSVCSLQERIAMKMLKCSRWLDRISGNIQRPGGREWLFPSECWDTSEFVLIFNFYFN